MEAVLKSSLDVSYARPFGSGAGGCISAGQAYETSKGKFFVKVNHKSEAKRMFDGEIASLQAIQATNTVRVPKPEKVVPNDKDSGAILIMEHLDMRGLGKYSAQLGEQLARYNKAKRMFDGEIASLQAIQATNTVRVPKPEKVVPNDKDSGAILIMEHLDMRGLGKYSAQLGEQLARLHLYNEELGQRLAVSEGHIGGKETAEEYVTKFGFHTTTCCGYLPQNNDWNGDWVEFYAQHRLKFQLDLIEKNSGDREARELWPLLERNIPRLFKDIDVKPALLHGDLWGGNTAETESGPVIFDAASCYGHSEFDLSIASMFGGFNNKFYSAYHQLIPKAPGFDVRQKLYNLYHYLNHWNHFGSGYRSSSISIMKTLAKS